MWTNYSKSSGIANRSSMSPMVAKTCDFVCLARDLFNLWRIMSTPALSRCSLSTSKLQFTKVISIYRQYRRRYYISNEIKWIVLHKISNVIWLEITLIISFGSRKYLSKINHRIIHFIYLHKHYIMNEQYANSIPVKNLQIEYNLKERTKTSLTRPISKQIWIDRRF